MKIYKGLGKEALVRLYEKEVDKAELDRLLHGPLFHDVFDPDFNKWRFYNDGTESGATVKENEDTNHTTPDLTADYQIQLRARIQENGAGTLSGAATDDYGLEYSLNAGAYTAVTASSTHVQADTGSSLTDGGSTTNRLTAGSGSFVAGEQESANGVVEDHQLTGDNYTEHVWGLKVIETAVSNGDTIDFRITLNGGAPGMTNTVTPRITVTKTVPFAADVDYFAFYEDGTESGAALVYGDAQTAGSAIFPANIMRDHTVAGDRKVHLRYRVQETAGTAGNTTDDWGLEYRLNGGTWTNVPTSATTEPVEVDTASSLTDGSATTNRLPAGTGTFVAGEQEEGNAIVEDFQLTASNYTELVYALNLVNSNLSAGDRIEFRLEYNGAQTSITNSVTPTIVVNTGAVIRDWKMDYDGDAAAATVTVTKPTSLVEGDLMPTWMMLDTQTAGSFDGETGWTEVYDTLASGILGSLYWREAGASEPTTQVFSTTGTIAEDDVFCCLRVDGHDSTTPMPTTSSNSGESSAPVATGITTANNNALVLAICHFDGNDFTQWMGPPTATGITFVAGGEYQNGSGGSSGGFWAFGVKPTAGAIGNATWPSTTVVDGWISYMVEIKPGTTGSTFEESVTNAITSAYTLANTVTFGTAVTNAITAAATHTADATFETAVSNAASPTYTTAGGLIFEASTTDAASPTYTTTVDATFEGAITYSITAAATHTADATFETAVTNAAATTYTTDTGGSIYNPTVTNAVTAAYTTDTGGSIYNPTVSNAATMGMTLADLISYEVSVSYAAAPTATHTADATFETAATYTISPTSLHVGNLIIDTAVTNAAAPTYTTTGGLVFGASVSYSTSLTFTLLDEISFEEAVTNAITAAATHTADATFETVVTNSVTAAATFDPASSIYNPSVSNAVTAGYTTSTIGTFNHSVTNAAAPTYTPSATGTFNHSIAASTTVGYSTSATMILEAAASYATSLTDAYTDGFVAGGGSTWEEAVSYAAAPTFTTTATLAIASTVTYTVTAAATHTADATFEPSTTDAATAGYSTSTIGTFNHSVSAPLSTGFVTGGALTVGGSITGAVTAGYSSASGLVFGGSVTNAISPTDTLAFIHAFNEYHTAAATSGMSIACEGTFVPSVTVAATLTDAAASSGFFTAIWTEVDDSDDSIWVEVPTE